MPDIRDITPPDDFVPDPSTPWWIWVAIALGVIALLTLAFFLIRKKHGPRLSSAALDEARSSLSALREDVNNFAPNIFSSKISLILRRYLETAFRDPALFETDEEFSLRPNSLQWLPVGTRQAVIDHLHQLSSLKYSPSNTPPPTSLLDDTESLLTRLHRASTHHAK